MISVWACLVQNACGGVVQLTATKLLGLRSRAGGSRSEQAAETHTAGDQPHVTSARLVTCDERYSPTLNSRTGSSGS